MAYTPVMIDGQPYAVRLPTGGTYHGAASEWDAMLDILGEKNPLYHSKTILSWCQDTVQDHPDCRVYRGQLSTRHWNNTYSYRAYPHVGYRPVLEPLNPETFLPAPDRLAEIPDGSILSMGSFYVNGIPQVLPNDPFWCGDIPQYLDNKILSIGETSSDPRKQLRFIKCGGLLWCDRNLMTNLSWDTLESFGLVFGREDAALCKPDLINILSESENTLQRRSAHAKGQPLMSERER